MNIGLVVDLRNSNEAERDGRGPLPGLGAEYRHFPLLEGRGIPPFTGGDVVERLSATYQWLVHNSGLLVGEAVSAIGAADGKGVVFHCSAGKDRTGMLAALILEVLGVDAETIGADYLLTNKAIEGILRRIKAMENNYTATTQSLAAQPAAFQRIPGHSAPGVRRSGIILAAVWRNKRNTGTVAQQLAGIIREAEWRTTF